MLELKIVLDEEKVIREDRYDLSLMWKMIDTCFLEDGLIKIEKGWYRDSGRDEDFAMFWRNIWALVKTTDWFFPNVRELLWFNSDDGVDEDDFVVEAVLAYCREHLFSNAKGVRNDRMC